MVGGVRITPRPSPSSLILSTLLCVLWVHGRWHHTDGVIVHTPPYICSVTLGNVLIFGNKKKWYCYDVMEINYFDLSGNFTLIFFSFSLWETTGPSFSNYALAKKKKKCILSFHPQKWVQVRTQYTGRTNRWPMWECWQNYEERSFNFLGHMHKSLSKTEAITEKSKERWEIRRAHKPRNDHA